MVVVVEGKLEVKLPTIWTDEKQRWEECTTACTFSTSQLPKVVRAWCALYSLTWKCASGHNGVHFFDISTSKNAPRLACFVHFDFEMCFAPQRRACTFSTSQLLRVLRTWCALYILTWKCASRHNGVQLFISHLTTWLRTRRFSEPTFRPSGATNHWNNNVFRDFPTFSRTWIFFLLTLSLFDLLSSSLLFSESSHLCFSSVRIVGSLTSKLPSMVQSLKLCNVLGSRLPVANQGTCSLTDFGSTGRIKHVACCAFA